MRARTHGLRLVPRESPEMRRYKLERDEKELKKRQNYAGVYLSWLLRTDLGTEGAAKAIAQAHAEGRYQPGEQSEVQDS